MHTETETSPSRAATPPPAPTTIASAMFEYLLQQSEESSTRCAVDIALSYATMPTINGFTPERAKKIVQMSIWPPDLPPPLFARQTRVIHGFTLPSAAR